MKKSIMSHIEKDPYKVKCLYVCPRSMGHMIKKKKRMRKSWSQARFGEGPTRGLFFGKNSKYKDENTTRELKKTSK